MTEYDKTSFYFSDDEDYSITEAGTSKEPAMPELSMDSDDPSDSEPVQLQPFIHQVGGHTCVLRFNETTLCKPLDLREQDFYETVPSELKEFVPDYRGQFYIYI